MHCIRPAHLAVCLLALAAIFAGCASTSLVDQWKSPEFQGPPLRKVMVVGVSSQPATRRTFEDEFAAALKTAGVTAVPSYTVMPQDGQADQAVLEQAVKSIGADGVLITRLLKREQKTEVSPGYYPPMAPMGG